MQTQTLSRRMQSTRGPPRRALGSPIRGATLPPGGEASHHRPPVHTSDLMIGCRPAGDGQLHASDWRARGGGQTADCRVSHRQDGPSAAGSFHTSACCCQGRSPLMGFLFIYFWSESAFRGFFSFDPQTTQPRRGRTQPAFLSPPAVGD